MEEEISKSLKPACIHPGCTRDTYGGSRGLCLNHYAVKQDLVKRGRTTWEQLEKEGKSLPKLDKVGRANLKKIMRPKVYVYSLSLQKFVFVDRDKKSDYEYSEKYKKYILIEKESVV